MKTRGTITPLSSNLCLRLLLNLLSSKAAWIWDSLLPSQKVFHNLFFFFFHWSWFLLLLCLKIFYVRQWWLHLRMVAWRGNIVKLLWVFQSVVSARSNIQFFRSAFFSLYGCALGTMLIKKTILIPKNESLTFLIWKQTPSAFDRSGEIFSCQFS